MSVSVSVITPVYNSGELLKELHRKILNQSYSDFEWIIINDGSDDEETLSILQQIEDDTVYIRLITTSNRGAPAARNKGIELAKGSFLKFLDSDDLIPDNHLSSQMNKMHSCQYSSDVVVSPQKIMNDFNGERSIIYSNKLKKEFFNKPLLNSLRMFEFHHSGCLYATDFIRKHVYWDESLQAYQDLDFLWQVMLAGAEFHIDNDTYFINREHNYTRRITSRKSASKWTSRFEAVKKVYKELLKRGYDEEYIENTYTRFDNLIVGAFEEFPKTGLKLLKVKKELTGQGLSVFMIKRYLKGIVKRYLFYRK